MSLRREAEEIVDRGFSALGRLVRDEIQWRRDHPCRQALIHKRMAEMLRVRHGFLWRARVRWHRTRREYWYARCDAKEAGLCGL